MDKEKEMLISGREGHFSFVVGQEHTARSVGSGQRDELATPALAAFFEAAAQAAAAPCLAEGEQTVGVRLALSHTAATPVGMAVSVCARLVSVRGRELVFQLSARDETEEIASGEHVRMLAKAAVMDRLLQKKYKRRKGTEKSMEECPQSA
ncbi:MAG: thioesterase [Oxalobacter formigenes]|nr:thioesterase [Oxalobacter formigenes]